MYTICVQDTKNGAWEFEHITKISYTTALGNTTLEGEDIFTHIYPTNCDLHLFSEKNAYTISKNSISVIQVSKEV